MKRATLYVVPGSHSSMAARLMLEHKAIEYRRVDLLPAFHKPILRTLGFRATTVPALRLAGRRIQGTRTISRALDELVPEAPLFPANPAARAAVEAAEHWGERVLQPIPRRLSWWSLDRDRAPLTSFAEGARLHVPIGLAVRVAKPITWAETRINGADDAAIRADLAALPRLLDRIDAWLDEGVLGGVPPSAADYQIATSVRLLSCFADLAPLLDGRALTGWSRALVPEFPGAVPAILSVA